jgi:eukaryotic-like serine/threonine-protein kinase
MIDASACRRRIRFGPYEADLAAGELRKNGRLIRLQEQPFQVLAVLLERPGEVVTRDELRERLWAGETFVDFDQGLNTAISKLREALGDSAANPRFVETVPRRGYRFTFPLEKPSEPVAALETLVPVAEASAGRRWPRWLETTWMWQAVAGCCLILAATFAFLWLRQSPPERHTAQFHIEPPAETHFTALHSGTAISPDGRFIVFSATAGALVSTVASPLWLRPLDSVHARPLPETAGGDYPFWSPDSKSLAFFSLNGRLMRIDITGGPAVELCVCAGSGGSWSRDGVILFAAAGGLRRVPAAGGMPEKVTEIDASRRETSHESPQFLPGGKRFLYLIGSTDPNTRGVYVGSLDRSQQRNRLLATKSKAIYTPPHHGHTGSLLWLRERTLLSQTFDADSLRLRGDPAPVAENMTVVSNDPRVSLYAAFWASDTGILAYHDGEAADKTRLVWMSREGKRLEEAGPEDRYGFQALSPDGKRVAVGRVDATYSTDVWSYEFSRKVMTRLTFDPANDFAPIWSPDGRQIVFSSNRSGITQLYRKNADSSGPEEQLTSDPGSGQKWATDWSRDGRYLLYSQYSPKTSWDLWALPLEGDRKPVALVQNPWNEGQGVFSPDGKWIAYISTQSVPVQVFVQAFTGSPSPAGGKWQVSKNGGLVPLWRGDGKELFYFVPAQVSKFMAAGIRVESGVIEVGAPRELFSAPTLDVNFRSWSVTADGQRFLIEESAAPASTSSLTVILNWQAGMKK